MKRFGRVVSVRGNQAKVLIQKHSACKNCGKCHDTSQKVKIRNSAQADPGDIVALEMEGTSLSTAAIMVYLVPVIGLIAGYLLGVYLGFSQEWIRIVIGGLLFGLAFWLARQVGEANFANYNVTMTKIINQD